ncbi:hypothetical protein CAL18_14725 [Bordetella genomosp. 7]|nr:hypothetical protein CAL18_14725 [Bordetella genomosp. 7]
MTTRRTLMQLGIAAAMAGAGMLALAPSHAASQEEPRKLSVANATVSTPPYAAYNTSVPMEIFFKEEGIDVQMLHMGGATVATQALGTGKVDIAVPASSAPLALLDKMPDAGIVGFYTFINGFQSMPVVLPDSPIADLKDLSGKTIGVQTLGNSQVQTTKALVQIAGGDAASLRFVAVGEGVEAAHALTTKRIDALVLFDGLYGQIEANGQALRRLSSSATGRDEVGFSGVIIARKKFLDENRDTFVRYGRAIAKSTVFAKANPEAAVRIHWKHFPETRMRGVSEEEAMRLALPSLKNRLDNVYEVDGMWGNSTLQQVKGYIRLNQLGGQLTKGESLERLWDPALMKEINDFDQEEIRVRARNWKP